MKRRSLLSGMAAGAAVLAYGYWRARGRAQKPETALRLRALLLAAALGVLAALLLPNTLEWKSDSPYLDTVTGVVNYQKGSGHGRLVQYGRTLGIAAAHPLLGVGPGNWTLVYPKSVDGFDPSIDYYYGLTINPWPSSDWMAIASERGFPALAAILLALGTALFAGDLVFRHSTGYGLFPMSAPTGGVIMMAGWLTVALAPFLPKKDG